jgi:competence protein ComEA
MIIEDDEDPQGQLFYLEKLKEIISLYKFPFVLGTIGCVLFILALILVIKSATSSSQVVFTSEASDSAKAKIRIDIAGAVLKPGVYEMVEGERVADALTAASGLSADADREWIAKNLNRAAKLIDGGKIYIPSQNEGKSSVSTQDTVASSITIQDKQNSGDLLGVTTGKVNVNSASQAELEALPGIGPVTAGKIISGRPYQSVEELKAKKIVGNAVFEKIKNLITSF